MIVFLQKMTAHETMQEIGGWLVGWGCCGTCSEPSFGQPPLIAGCVTTKNRLRNPAATQQVQLQF